MIRDMSGEPIAYTFDDIILIPQYSTLRSRSEADTTFKFWKYERPTPIISANMETITGSEMAIAMWNLGGIGALHRFWSIEENVEAYLEVYKANCDCIVSIGVNGDFKERAEALFKAGARMFVIDIAHGHSVMMKETIEWLRGMYKEEIFIVAGNVATGQATKDLYEWGADCVKIGVGPGSVCTTRVVTGHGVPSFTAINDCSYWSRNKGKLIIADGGMKSSGDMVKAFVAGADCVMIGGLLSGTDETPGEIVGDLPVPDGVFWPGNPSYPPKKIFKGSSSYDRGPGVAKEGIEIEVPYKGEVASVINELVAGIRSGMSYSNANTLSELRVNADFKIQTMAGFSEGLPHMKGNR